MPTAMGLFTGEVVLNPKPRSRTLMDAVRDDDRNLVTETLNGGESVTQTNAYLRTPLHKAAYYSGDRDVVASLIDRGADVNARDKGDWTPLHLATRNSHLGAMRALLDAGAETQRVDAKHGWTPLHVACVAGHEDAARMLVEAGADVTVRDKSTASAIDLMRESGIDPGRAGVCDEAAKPRARTTDGGG